MAREYVRDFYIVIPIISQGRPASKRRPPLLQGMNAVYRSLAFTSISYIWWIGNFISRVWGGSSQKVQTSKSCKKQLLENTACTPAAKSANLCSLHFGFTSSATLVLADEWTSVTDLLQYLAKWYH